MHLKPGASLSEIESVYRERFPEFRRVAAAIVGDRDAALDVVQEAFGRAIRRRRTFRGEGPIEAWIWRMVVNVAADYRRLEPLPVTPHIDRGNGQGEGSPALSVAVSLLPERQRLALFLRYYADLDYKTIAEALGVTPGTVAASLNAAHATLKRALLEASR